MAILVKSTAISNRDATPTLPTGASMAGGMLREFEGYVSAVATTHVAGTIFDLVSVPSNMRISEITLQCAALGTSATVDCGVYVPTQGSPSLVALNAAYTPGAAIDQDFFASAVDVHAALTPTNITNESGTNTIDKQEQELWQAVGLASDPCCSLDIALTVVADIATSGKVGIKVRGAM